MARFFADDGVAIHYRDEGHGRPIVFVHGWMMSGGFFRKQFEALASEYRCVALDLRGCGSSGTRPGTHTMDSFAKDLARLLDDLELTDVTLVGWSLGGGISMRYLDEARAKRVTRVALVDFPPVYREDPTTADKVCHKLATGRAAFLESFFRRMFLHPPSPTDAQWMMSETDRCATETACEMYRQLPAGSAEGKRYDLPALLAFPTQGWFPTSVPAWREILPRSTVPEFRESRHCPFWEEPDTFNRALADFVG